MEDAFSNSVASVNKLQLKPQQVERITVYPGWFFEDHFRWDPVEVVVDGFGHGEARPPRRVGPGVGHLAPPAPPMRLRGRRGQLGGGGADAAVAVPSQLQEGISNKQQQSVWKKKTRDDMAISDNA